MILPVFQAARFGAELVTRVDRCTALKAYWGTTQVSSNDFHGSYDYFSCRNDRILVLVAHLYDEGV